MDPNLDVIADPTRRSILALLAVEGEVCVCEFVAAFDEVQPSVSRHLALLRDAGWIAARREGTWMHYRLARLPSWAKTVVEALVAGGVPAPVLRKARARLTAFSGRPKRTTETIA
jgi:ArsR family transcriptional regulator, arsenate/arsenite/antimonite-responsive transcriptional repressor